MAYYRSGDIIRLNRLALGISQEELSFDICSVETLSRIENGHHKIKPATYRQLMARMERVPEKIYAIGVGKDMELLEECTLIGDALNRGDYPKADYYLPIIKRKIADDTLNQQYFLRIQALVDYHNGRIDSDVLNTQLECALNLTVKNYMQYIDTVYPFTHQELYILLNLANSHNRMGKYRQSIPLYHFILRCVSENYMDDENSIILKILTLRQLCLALCFTKKSPEALNLLPEIFTLCVKANYESMMPLVLCDAAWILDVEICRQQREHNDYAKVKHLLQQAYWIAVARNDTILMHNIKKYWEAI